MPANLPPQYLKAEEEYRKASTPDKRLEKLRELFRLLPKHKGTEKLQSDLKQKISQLSEEVERGKAGAKKAGVEPSRAAGGGRPGGAGRCAERGEERAAGGADQRPARDRRLSVHDPGAAAGDHDVAGCAGPARRPAADRAGFFEPWVPSVIRSADAALWSPIWPATTWPKPPWRCSTGWPRSYRAGRRAALRRGGRADPPPQDGHGRQQARRRGGRRSAGDRPRVVRAPVPDRGGLGRDRRGSGNAAVGGIRFIGCACESIRKSLASRPIGPDRSRFPSAVPFWIWPGKFIGTSSIR